jgi:Winged helix-turn helix
LLSLATYVTHREAERIRARFRLDYTLAGVDLLHRIGWSVQLPARQAAERDEARRACLRGQRGAPQPAKSAGRSGAQINMFAGRDLVPRGSDAGIQNGGVSARLRHC